MIRKRKRGKEGGNGPWLCGLSDEISMCNLLIFACFSVDARLKILYLQSCLNLNWTTLVILYFNVRSEDPNLWVAPWIEMKMVYLRERERERKGRQRESLNAWIWGERDVNSELLIRGIKLLHLTPRRSCRQRIPRVFSSILYPLHLTIHFIVISHYTHGAPQDIEIEVYIIKILYTSHKS